MSENNRLVAIIEAANGADVSFVVNEVYGQVNSLTLKSVRIPAKRELALSINQTVINDGILRFTPTELDASLFKSGYGHSKSRVKGAGMEYIYYFSQLSEQNPRLPKESRYSIDPSYMTWKREREAVSSVNGAALFGSLRNDGVGIQFSEKYIKSIKKDAGKF